MVTAYLENTKEWGPRTSELVDTAAPDHSRSVHIEGRINRRIICNMILASEHLAADTWRGQKKDKWPSAELLDLDLDSPEQRWGA